MIIHQPRLMIPTRFKTALKPHAMIRCLNLYSFYIRRNLVGPRPFGPNRFPVSERHSPRRCSAASPARPSWNRSNSMDTFLTCSPPTRSAS